MQNQQQMAAMAGMNAAGGPVGGTPLVNNARLPGEDRDPITQLNTYIYDYFLRNNHLGIAKQMCDEGMKMSINKPENEKTMNGMDQLEAKDLPCPRIPDNYPVENSFLLDWWSQFWDIYGAARAKGKPSTIAQQYLAHNRQLAQMQTNQRMLMAGNLNPQYRQMLQGHMPNGVGGADLKRTVLSSRNPNPAQMANMNQMKPQGMTAPNMQRDHSGMDLNGQHPQSPASAENAPSPNKRPRVEGNNFNGQPMGPTRTQGMSQQPMGATAQGNQMMMGAGNQFNDFAQPTSNVNKASLEVYAQSLAEQQRSALNNQTMPKGMNGVQGSPMNQPGLDGESNIFAGNPTRMPGGAAGQPQSNHALQDYQMQLMLLEQQNKKRLLMARQEQDNMSQGGPHGQAAIGAAGFAPAMSPSRAGPSPNPNDQQIKRGTPKMTQQGLPASPMPDVSMQNRNSPVPNFDPNQMQPGVGVPPQFYPQMQQNPMMRPPSSHPGFNGQITQMDAMRGANYPNGNWQRSQMVANPGQQPGPMNMAQQRGNPMPPPPAPPGGEQPGRSQEPSPSQPAPAPPTPNQPNKANPRKKDTKENKKKSAKKNPATAGTAQTAEAEPPTPTPPTPITPMNPASFGKPNGQGQQHQQATQSAVAPQAPQVQPPPMDGGAPFGNIPEDNSFPGLDIGEIVGDPGFTDFDFDSFLHTEDTGAFGSIGDTFNFPDSVETGNGDL
ncbi:hypothetical protein GQ43DRAFT_1618 [Delitschia confertaspora ATCC 74209]|uniref:LisH domain-containing protein n=1 Tax=Delitschia confertaspora ATCC 74209 TaxID=1513339 RepID=A0A9P4K0U2_9PLEO|nr:hypothetical protein GQ43DRAFT_1618 [Delitschia confertaspora ATCC 74209]